MKIDFEFTTHYGVYRDALYLDDDHQYTEYEIACMKQERLNNWLEAVENPPVLESTNVEISDILYNKAEASDQTVSESLEA